MTTAQVGENLPATSYIKMIDVWLLFNLTIPFALIIIHTYMDYIRRWIELHIKQVLCTFFHLIVPLILQVR